MMRYNRYAQTYLKRQTILFHQTRQHVKAHQCKHWLLLGIRHLFAIRRLFALRHLVTLAKALRRLFPQAKAIRRLVRRMTLDYRFCLQEDHHHKLLLALDGFPRRLQQPIFILLLVAVVVNRIIRTRPLPQKCMGWAFNNASARVTAIL